MLVFTLEFKSSDLFEMLDKKVYGVSYLLSPVILALYIGLSLLCLFQIPHYCEISDKHRRCVAPE